MTDRAGLWTPVVSPIAGRFRSAYLLGVTATHNAKGVNAIYSLMCDLVEKLDAFEENKDCATRYAHIMDVWHVVTITRMPYTANTEMCRLMTEALNEMATRADAHILRMEKDGKDDAKS